MKSGWAFGIIVTLVLAGCASDDPADPSGSASPTGTRGTGSMGGNGSDAEPARMYTVATDFSSQPDTIYKFRPAAFPNAESGEIKVGGRLNITLKSAIGNQNPHDLVIDELDVRIGPLTAGAAESVIIELTQAGSFQFYCSVTNHRNLGMEGTLTVS